MMSSVAKLSNLLLAATCVREIVDDAGTEARANSTRLLGSISASPT
jgi:hypothetical protein